MYILTKQEDCPRCERAGVVTHPEWNTYWKKHPKGLKTYQEDCTYFAVQGYHRPPPEEIKCRRCNGSGTIESEATLTEALRNLGFGQLVQLPEATK